MGGAGAKLWPGGGWEAEKVFTGGPGNCRGCGEHPGENATAPGALPADLQQLPAASCRPLAASCILISSFLASSWCCPVAWSWPLVVEKEGKPHVVCPLLLGGIIEEEHQVQQ